MSFSFDPDQGLIVVKAELDGPTGSIVLRLAVDTGATRTLVNSGPLVTVGYDPALSPKRMQITTASGVEFVPLFIAEKIVAVGLERRSFEVIGHTLPTSAGIDGLLGLDFFSDTSLTIDFRTNEIRMG